MSYIKPIGAVAVIIALATLTYSHFIRADISFTQKPQVHSTSVANPINEVEYGSIVYTLSDKSTLTQMALDTKVRK